MDFNTSSGFSDTTVYQLVIARLTSAKVALRDSLVCAHPQVASAAFPFLMRLGCGGFVSGFRSSLPEDDGNYSVAQVAGEPRG